MPVFALLIISKAGSLIYHRTFPTSSSTTGSQPATGTLGLPGTTSLTTNDYLVLAGTFHGVHAITKSLTPRVPAYSASSEDSPSVNGATIKTPAFRYPNPELPVTGIESLESSFFKLTVFQTLTGTKFLLFTDPSMPNTDGLIRGIYDRYADHVCKNPFWHVDNPIRLEGWDRALSQFLFRR
ncbi:hypothetical protein H2198_003950 [Neophaeococcomyces mojaviensis]|uniref:Uncharacterized protein n=1 Tax=Neophaeococcomyces mojaviensis TaxID=3383035 RepID=A0ACC3A9U7_9EURO|nr:hypothetical protein H2198_003950 [Knufia sp. JES_112]